MRNKIQKYLFIVLLLGAIPLKAQTILVETESFQNVGGWVIDPQFTLEMGSPYLLAHGLGTPVADASTTITLPSIGTYHVWARTKDWVAQWKAPGAPGKFQISINDTKLDTVFGTRYATWTWHYGGYVNINNINAQIKLIDLAGFEGRCDAIILSKDLDFSPSNNPSVLANWRKTMLGNSIVRNAGKFDFVIIGGGIAGTTAAISAARLGLKVALIQDRPVVGGNNSTEVRVGLGGAINVHPYTNLGNIVAEITVPVNPLVPAGNGKDSVYDDTMRMKVLSAEKNITLFMNCKADSITKISQSIRSVLAQNTKTGERIEVFGTYFADCTGDGTIGYLAGADYEVNLTQHMGNSNLWNLRQYSTPQPFPRCPWALDLTNSPFPGRPGIDGAYSTSGINCLGGWYWETGFKHNPITEIEYARDYNFRAMYGAWDCVKNVDKIYSNYKLNWAAYITGKRESRLLLGDVQLTKKDLLNSTEFPDGFIGVGWNIDIHVPDLRFQNGLIGEEFISIDNQTSFHRPFYIPYRCLYSRNINNLFMAGRDISVTQEALGAVRVMKTTGMMGEVVGMAAAIARKHATLPRNIYTNYLNELTNYIYRGIPAVADTLIISPIIEPDPLNPQIIVDNTDVECTFDNPWPTSTYVGGYFGRNYQVNTGADSTKWAKWTPTISRSGKYRVYMNWTSGSDRPVAAPVEINSKDSITTIKVDQTKNGCIWNYLGTCNFLTGTSSYVKLSSKSTGSTIADAVLFEFLSDFTGISSTVNKDDEITVFPHNGIYSAVVNLNSDSQITLSVYTLFGVEVRKIVTQKHLMVGNYSYTFNLHGLASGIYMLSLTTDNKKICKKIPLISLE